MQLCTAGCQLQLTGTGIVTAVGIATINMVTGIVTAIGSNTISGIDT
jgi:hypothetical protein